MEREIKFRAKSLNGHWVEGYYIKFETRQICPMGDDELKDDEIVHLIARDGFADWNMPKQLEFIKIDKETKGQFTGLKDKNGKEIYEGDILKNVREKSIYEVKWIDRDCRFGLIYNFVKTYEGEPVNITRDDIPMNRIPDCEVIGNIYENKELLKGETK